MKNFLDIEFYSDDLGKTITVKGFFKQLLTTLFEEGEGFSGKRPFGNYGWERDLEAAAIRKGFIKGTLDEDGYVETSDEKAFYKLIHKSIEGL